MVCEAPRWIAGRLAEGGRAGSAVGRWEDAKKTRKKNFSGRLPFLVGARDSVTLLLRANVPSTPKVHGVNPSETSLRELRDFRCATLGTGPLARTGSAAKRRKSSPYTCACVHASGERHSRAQSRAARKNKRIISPPPAAIVDASCGSTPCHRATRRLHSAQDPRLSVQLPSSAVQ